MWQSVCHGCILCPWNAYNYRLVVCKIQMKSQNMLNFIQIRYAIQFWLDEIWTVGATYCIAMYLRRCAADIICQNFFSSIHLSKSMYILRRSLYWNVAINGSIKINHYKSPNVTFWLTKMHTWHLHWHITWLTSGYSFQRAAIGITATSKK